jgi:alkyl sulfatase BDS1-like metallo-beta-lactamase superfamily hydrolase
MHHWPVWGNGEITAHLKLQRDMYRYINDETLRLANHGYTMTEIAEMFEMPKEVATHFSNRGYYGSVNHNVKATYVLYLGWFIGNPATLNPMVPVEASERYVEMMGGADALVSKAKEYYAKGEYRWVAEVVNHAVFADPSNQAAKNLQADALEQMGYQAESGPWRNFYLTGAKELRDGVAKMPAPNTASPDTIRAMSLDLFFDFLGMRLNGPEADGKRIVLNFDFTDVRQKYMIEMVHGVLNHTSNRQADKADATITLSRETLNQIVLQETTMKDAIDSGAVKIVGSQAKLEEMLSHLDTFDFWFNIVTP